MRSQCDAWDEGATLSHGVGRSIGLGRIDHVPGRRLDRDHGDRRLGSLALARGPRPKWTPVVITLGSRRVLGIAYGDMLEVEIELEAEGQAWPDGEWLTLFREYAKFPSDLEEPRLEHGKLRFEVHEAELQRAWKAIKERVHATNRLYCDLLAPRDRAGQRDEDARRDSVDERIRHAQRSLDALD
jgi:hypothetical protein